MNMNIKYDRCWAIKPVYFAPLPIKFDGEKPFMGRKSKLAHLTTGEIANLVNEKGQLGAALTLGISPSAISHHLRKRGYHSVTVYLEDGQTVTITDTGASVPFQMVEGQS